MAPTIPIKINNSIILLDNVSQILYDVNMKDKKKKYKVYIEWETEVEAKDYNEAILEGSDDWIFNYDHDHFKAEEIKQMIKYYLNICPICDQETHYDQWAKPQVACIDCGFED